MFALSARKVAIVAAIGLGSALSIGALAAQAASTSTTDDQIRPTTVSSTDDGTVDLRGDGTLEDNGVVDGLRGDGTLDDDDDDTAPTPAPGTPGGLPTDADHPQGDDSIGRADDRSGSSDDSADDQSGHGDDGADDSGHSDDSDDSDSDGASDDGDDASDDDDDNSGHGGGDDD